MILKRLLSLFIPLLLANNLSAQVTDTLRVMHYNLLNYRNTTSFCTESNNNAAQKDGHLKTIFQYVKPDIFTINEMGANWTNANKLLINAILKDGIDNYDQAEYSTNGTSSLVNMLFFNTDKLELHSQMAITKDKNGAKLLRAIDLYTLYYKDDVGLAKGDTIFILVVVAHLKAGSTSNDKNLREKEANALMDYFNDNNERINYLLCGDFNIQSSNESSYQAFTNHSNANIRFYDPVDADGAWNNKSIYSNLHTQSTRTSSNGCFSGGGMDDRFDFILCGNEVLMNDYDVQYIDGSYEALGQDSRRFNGSINSPANIAVPKSVADALYNMSDHLPVVMDLKVKTQKVSVQEVPLLQWSFRNPVTDLLQIESVLPIDRIEIYSLEGQLVWSNNFPPSTEISASISDLSNGIYFIKVSSPKGIEATKKLILRTN